MKLWLAALLLAGCSDSRTVVVTAWAGDKAEADLPVLSHAHDGTVIDRATTDGDGHALLVVSSDALVSVVFPAVIEPETTIRVVTTQAPVDEVTMRLPSAASELIGTLTIEGLPPTTAEYFHINLGCANATVTSLPATIDVPACARGTDTQLDIVVEAWHHTGGDLGMARDGYSAGRVPLLGNAATFQIPAWNTEMSSAPVDLVGVVPQVELTVFADGLPFETQDVIDHALLWNGLNVDTTQATAILRADSLTGRTTSRAFPGVPQSMTYADSDFLPLLAPKTTLKTLNPLAFHWEAAAVGDAMELRVTWDNDAVGVQNHIEWTVVLPPDRTDVTFPIFDDALAPATSRPDIWGGTVGVVYVESEAHEGFAALVADGIDLEASSPPLVQPSAASVRTSYAAGCECSAPRTPR